MVLLFAQSINYNMMFDQIIESVYQCVFTKCLISCSKIWCCTAWQAASRSEVVVVCFLEHSVCFLEHSVCFLEHSVCFLEHSAWILKHSGKFWNILENSAIILEHSACILAHSACILEHSACILEHSGSFWIILEHSWTFWRLYTVWKTNWPRTGTQTDRQTHRH